jgi:hypothetical protein
MILDVAPAPAAKRGGKARIVQQSFDRFGNALSVARRDDERCAGLL